MKHFKDDEEYDSMKEYEFNLMSHLNEEEEMTDNYDSNLFSHWKEDHMNNKDTDKQQTIQMLEVVSVVCLTMLFF